MVAPMAVAVFTIPIVLDGMGAERFGVLTIVWFFVGYLSLFDLGLGRALTKLTAERLLHRDDVELERITWTALYLMAGLGLFAAVLLLLGSPYLVQALLRVPQSLHSEALTSFQLVAVVLPLVITTSAMTGILEAYEKFSYIALIRVGLGISTFVGPLISLQFSESLVPAVSLLLVFRCGAFFVYFYVARIFSKSLQTLGRPQRSQLAPLLRFGGWLTVCNILNPLMIYIDRFFVGAKLGMTAVSYYVTPYEVMMRLQVLPAAVVGVLFPALSRVQSENWDQLTLIYKQALTALLLMMLPPMVAAFLFAPELLEIWLGPEFRDSATTVVRWLAVGWAINVASRVSFIAILSVGRADLLGKAHCAEFVPYIVLLWLFTSSFGLAGTAAAWFVRIIADTILLNELVAVCIRELRGAVVLLRLLVPTIAIGFLFLSMFESIVSRIFLMLLVGALCLLGLIFLLRDKRLAFSFENRDRPNT